MHILQLFSDQTGRLIETNAFQDVIAEKEIHALSECSLGNDREWVVLVPGENIFVTTIELPRVRAAERTRIAPFVLEEQLATEPESVYVVLGNTDKKGKTVVAITNQLYIDTIFSAIKKAELNPIAAIPDFLAVQWTPETWTVVFDQQRAFVRTGIQSGFTLDADNADIILTQLLKKTSEKPVKIVVWEDTYPHDLSQLAAQNSLIERRSQNEKNKWDVAGLLSQLNLLQGKYRPKIAATALQKKWRWCGILFVSWIVFLFMSQGIQYVYLEHESKKIDNQILSVYQKLFPGSNAALAPRSRTDILLSHYDQASKNAVFLKSYRAIGQMLLQYPTMHLVSFSFENNQMTLTMDAPTQALLMNGINMLRTKKINVMQKSQKTLPNGSEIVVVLS